MALPKLPGRALHQRRNLGYRTAEAETCGHWNAANVRGVPFARANLELAATTRLVLLTLLRCALGAVKWPGWPVRIRRWMVIGSAIDGASVRRELPEAGRVGRVGRVRAGGPG